MATDRPTPDGTTAGSLQRRLMVRLVIVLALVAAGLFLLIRMDAKRAADGAFDQLLLASALSIVDAVRVEDNALLVDLPYSSLSILAMAQRDRAFYKVLDAEGNVIIGYGDLPGPPRRDDNADFFDAVYHDEPVRIVALGHLIVQARRANWVTIVVAQTREERDRLARGFFINSFLPMMLMMLVSIGLVWFGVRQALAPLGFLERLIRARRPSDFSPIEVPAPAEVRQLLGAINTLMARLHGNLESTKTFLADMAHQIRTPLAALRSQSELASEENDPERLHRIVARIHRNAVEASELTTQLLSHAMVVHRSEALHPEFVDLTLLVRRVVQRAAAIAEDTTLRIEQDGTDHVGVCGDSVILREALVNLVDNAIKYGGGAGAVEVRLCAATAEHGPLVEVADRGPGVPDAEKPTVLSRFGRGSSAAGTVGSGLGLAIVAAVADGHGAAFSLLDRPGGGLIARIAFPRDHQCETCQLPPSDDGSENRHRAAPERLWLPLALLALSTILLWPGESAAKRISYPAQGTQAAVLAIASTTDQAAMEGLILDFQAHHPGIRVEYDEVTSVELYDSVVHPKDRLPDLIISSSADLQVKLVNDGYTQRHLSEATADLPRWANWRDEAFSFAQEPAVIVYNRDLVPPSDVPRTRDDLIHLIRDREAVYDGRVATYDIVQSGIGYLLASQDSVLNSQFWQLVDALADRHVHQFCCTGEMLDAIARGDQLIGYNLLGSYARARQLAGAPIGIVLPSDYTLVTARVASIPRGAAAAGLAGLFIDYLLSQEGQTQIARSTPFYAISPAVDGPFSVAHLLAELNGPLQHTTLGPGLLVFLDETKRARFLRQWQMITNRY
ncbi:histidine kinase [Azospirillum sp. TSH100]|uniref:sensor histidine kinase n=1 Tax=Azospirillum sp. TSH100 TaxID=652764 RepID=UPI000D61EEF5|nr:extracellular solute-binding protein [Azospirillum sp. TSH100]PWC84731.1 histidine kinase [Azospirillum sp. TSH100]QCG90139.1 extracellular solute-binding protein [Azospirillum sp. TSH100]